MLQDTRQQPVEMVSFRKRPLLSAVDWAIPITSLRVFAYPTEAQLTINDNSSFSSASLRYGSGPGLVPCWTQPLRRSFSVVSGTLCCKAASYSKLPFLYGFHGHCHLLIRPEFMPFPFRSLPNWWSWQASTVTFFLSTLGKTLSTSIWVKQSLWKQSHRFTLGYHTHHKS